MGRVIRADWEAWAAAEARQRAVCGVRAFMPSRVEIRQAEYEALEREAIEADNARCELRAREAQRAREESLLPGAYAWLQKHNGGRIPKRSKR